MYCPGCGSNNQAEVKFCARCGTNLVVVTQALTGKGGAQPKDRAEKILKKYYSGRRDTVTGAGLVAGGLMIMALLVAVGMKPMAAFWIMCWMFFWGVIALAIGLGNWLASSGEMKQFGYSMPDSQLPRPSEERSSLPANEPTALPEKGYSTDPINYPGSVTEGTTRHLEDRAYDPHIKGKSKQTG